LQQAAAAGAERHAQRQLARPCRRAGNHQVADVGTRHQQDQPDQHGDGRQPIAVPRLHRRDARRGWFQDDAFGEQPLAR
jgi:hypothetical protein